MVSPDKASLLIVSFFYGMTLFFGYFLFSGYHDKSGIEPERLIVSMDNNGIDLQNNSLLIQVDRGKGEISQKLFDSSSLVAVSLFYERKGYKLDWVTETNKNISGEEVVTTKLWYSRKQK
jgi:hypothetical protein|tara:strand:- start:167 stop:526 length:360 start_codon:yes stop_codon:yes gene_type:complete